MLETPRKRKVSDSTDRKRKAKQPRVSITMASSVENVQPDNSILDEDDEGLPAIPFLPRPIVVRTEQRNTNSAASSHQANHTIVNLSDSEPLTEEASIIVMNETSKHIHPIHPCVQISVSPLYCEVCMVVCRKGLSRGPIKSC